MNKRLCCACRTLKDKNELIKITKTAQDIVVNPNSKIFGRSAYICYNQNCIETAIKKNRLGKALKTADIGELKGQILNELRNNQNK